MVLLGFGTTWGSCCQVKFSELKPSIPLCLCVCLSSEAAFMEALQKKMEGTVMLGSGSYAQRVQAEYLKEIETRAKTVFQELASAS